MDVGVVTQLDFKKVSLSYETERRPTIVLKWMIYHPLAAGGYSLQD